jgi:hypothetical protein
MSSHASFRMSPANGRKDKDGIGHNVVVRRKQAPDSQGRVRGRGCRDWRSIATKGSDGVPRLRDALREPKRPVADAVTERVGVGCDDHKGMVLLQQLRPLVVTSAAFSLFPD